MKRIKTPAVPMLRFNPSPNDDRAARAMACLQDSRLSPEEAMTRCNLVLVGRTIATALHGSGLVVDPSEHPQQIAEVQIPSGFVIGVPVATVSY
jgi:hypothetical protein